MSDDPAGYVALVLLGFAAIVIITLMFYFFANRDKPVVRKASYVFLELMLLGTLLFAVSVILGLFTPTPITCNLSAWLFVIGAFLVFG